MLPRTIRRISTVLLSIGVGLIALGAALPPLTPSAVAGAASSTAQKTSPASSDSTNPDQVLRDEAAAVRRHVEEFRERSLAEEGHVDAARICYLIGAGLAVGGLIGRLASGRRGSGV